ncbi:MAG: hypothetical protein K6G10_07175 [Butyrivibrio sp.]|nr:hypothetical protein [Butyrivibrio sp.]
MDKLRKAIYDYFHAPFFLKRFIIMMLGVFFMGFFLSFLVEVDLGTDPCTFMNLTVSRRLGILMGTWQFALNAVLFIIVIAYGRKYIGLGTLANMTLIGYIVDLFTWLFEKYLPLSLFKEGASRIIIFVVALFLFIVAVGFYMNADMGVAPYDAVPMMVSEHLLKKIPFSFVRMGYDFTAIVIGVLLGGRLNAGIILMALFLGPIISAVGKFMGKHIFKING